MIEIDGTEKVKYRRKKPTKKKYAKKYLTLVFFLKI